MRLFLFSVDASQFNFRPIGKIVDLDREFASKLHGFSANHRVEVFQFVFATENKWDFWDQSETRLDWAIFLLPGMDERISGLEFVIGKHQMCPFLD